MASSYFLDNFCPQYLSKPKTRKVFIVGLPKCGTCSFLHLLRYLGYKTLHYVVDDTFVGKVMSENQKAGKPLMSGLLEGYNAIAQMDFCEDGEFIFPQMSMLDQLVTENPTGLFILNTRDLDSHIRSIIHWQTMLRDLQRFGYIEKTDKMEDTVRAVGGWILHHQQTVRQLFQEQYPNVRFLEVRIDSPNVNDQLKAFLECPKLSFPKVNLSPTRHMHQIKIRYHDLLLKETDKVILLGLPCAQEDIVIKTIARTQPFLSITQRVLEDGTSLGKAMQQRFQKKEDLLSDTSNIFAGLDVLELGVSIWPQWTMLDTLLKQYPTAIFILNRREDVEKHAQDILNSRNTKGEKYSDLFLVEDVPQFRHDNRMHPVYVARWIRKTHERILDRLGSAQVSFLDVDMDGDDASVKITDFIATCVSRTQE